MDAQTDRTTLVAPLKRSAPWSACALLSLAMAGPVLPADAGSAPSTAPTPAEHACPAPRIAVRARNAEDARDACRGAADAVAFFAAQGLRTDLDLVIEVLPELPDIVDRSAAGCFLETGRRVLLIDYAAFRRHGTWFGLPIDRGLYRSLASHETAHALAACNFTASKPSIQAKEYVAYVATFATMAPAQRAAALAALPGDGFADDMKITAVAYLVDPMRFGAEAWRHYLQPGRGADFLRDVLRGRALGE